MRFSWQTQVVEFLFLNLLVIFLDSFSKSFVGGRHTEVGEAKNLGDVRKVKVRNDMLF